MEHVHLAAEDEDDLYSGYNDYNPTFDTEVSNIFVIFMNICMYEANLVVVQSSCSSIYIFIQI